MTLPLIMVCRSSDLPLRRNSRPGEVCKMCSKRLAVSADGRERMRQGPHILVCQDCGILLSRGLKAQNKLAVELGPNVREQLKQDNVDPKETWLKEFLGE
jgi:RNase P subunit RPR2